jgi:two-component system, chemotaxis family, sensor kinase CheA
MDEFLQQFLIESRELVDQAADDLLALEKAPNDGARFDDAFRAFHTLKGGAAIVEFAAMEEAMHRAESVLAAARKASAPLSAPDIGNCLMCLDQVSEWLDAIEGAGALPPGASAAAVVARFAQPQPEPPRAAPRGAATEAWVEALVSAHAAAAAQARTAIRYVPGSDSFFRQADPVARIGALPGLLAIDAGPREPWPPLAELDPFSCNLLITALLAGAADAAAAALGDEARHCDVVTLADAAGAFAGHPLAKEARELLAAQMNLLADVGDRQEPGRIASAGAVAANVLRHMGESAEADRMAATAAACVAAHSPARLREAIAAALDGVPTPHAAPAGPAARAAPAARPALGRADAGAQTLRVDAARIDSLVRLTGELTVAKNAIGHAVQLAENEGAALAATLKNRHATLERLVAELQRSVVALRVLPLRIAFQRFPRLIREMSAELGKPATLVLEGEDTEADKAIVEILVEPLVHVLRNAMDHGVEAAPLRAAAGKPAVATIRMRAFREGEHVMLEVADDGAGIDVARVREVASERGVVPAETLAAMSDAQVVDLIFAPGFSTAAEVTEFSGRGVGMDAVRTAVKRLGGQVEASSVAGKGTTVRFTLPFSVMMTRVMTVDAGGQKFGIPLDAVVETLRVPRESIFAVGAAHAIVLRDKTIPLVRLAQVLGAGSKADGGEAAPIVIARVDGDLGALEVDRIGERMEIMLKPLDGLLGGLPSIAGSTLLGDGSVLLVLDVAELLR